MATDGRRPARSYELCTGPMKSALLQASTLLPPAQGFKTFRAGETFVFDLVAICPFWSAKNVSAALQHRRANPPIWIDGCHGSSRANLPERAFAKRKSMNRSVPNYSLRSRHGTPSSSERTSLLRAIVRAGLSLGASRRARSSEVHHG